MSRIPEHSVYLTQKRLLALVALTAFVFCVLGGRLLYLQVFEGEELQARAVDQWTRDLPLTALRGEILDAKGNVLASSYTTYTVYVRPRAVKDLDAVCGVLSAALGLDCNELREKLGKRVSELTVAKGVDKRTVDLIRSSGVEGVLFGESGGRVYPYADWFSRVLGFTNIDSVGTAGLEAFYDSYLKGTDGVALTQTDLVGIGTSGVPMYLPSIPGSTLVTTLDVGIQRLAEDVVKSASERFSPKSASCLVMDVRDGGIVALATAPSYDLNAPPRDDIDKLNALTKNLLVTDVYEPGSTFKIFTTAAALEEGLTSVGDRFYDPGYRIVDGQRIRCWKTIGHGSQTLAEGVQNSCNCVFMDLALRLGKEKLYAWLERFGFGKKTNVDFFGESGGIMMPVGSVKNVDLARIGFGQAVAVTPVQVLAGVSMAVNGGYPVQPHFAKTLLTEAGEIDLAPKPASSRILKAETSRLLCEMLELVVSKGGGKNAAVPGYKIGGKTGTAQKYENGAIAPGKYVSSFVGFAPADDPQYALIILVDEPQGWIYYGSQVAAPYASGLFRGIFEYAGIPPSEPAEPFPTIVVPDLTGLPYSQALASVAALGLQAETVGESGIVAEQVPGAGARIAEGGTMLLRFETSDPAA